MAPSDYVRLIKIQVSCEALAFVNLNELNLASVTKKIMLWIKIAFLLQSE